MGGTVLTGHLCTFNVIFTRNFSQIIFIQFLSLQMEDVRENVGNFHKNRIRDLHSQFLLR